MSPCARANDPSLPPSPPSASDSSGQEISITILSPGNGRGAGWRAAGSSMAARSAPLQAEAHLHAPMASARFSRSSLYRRSSRRSSASHGARKHKPRHPESSAHSAERCAATPGAFSSSRCAEMTMRGSRLHAQSGQGPTRGDSKHRSHHPQRPSGTRPCAGARPLRLQ